MTNIAVGGEVISVENAMKLVDELYDHAYELAGLFYEKNRSKKFRLNWPNEYEFAMANKRNFIEQARDDFTKLLSDPRVDERIKKKAYLALLLERAFAVGLENMGYQADNRLQVRTGTQQFEGDRHENANIMDKFGPTRNMRAEMLKSAAKISFTKH